jgi:hypothetical protein
MFSPYSELWCKAIYNYTKMLLEDKWLKIESRKNKWDLPRKWTMK